MKSQRGVHKIHNELFVNDTQENLNKSKGRSQRLILQRNECLVDRYLFYGLIGRSRYDVIVTYLSTDFFLSESTIAGLLNSHYAQVAKLKKTYQENSIEQLRKKMQTKWPSLSWKVNMIFN